MREIKFRGLDLLDGKWVYGSHLKTGVGLEYIVPQNLIANHLPQYTVDKDTVGQYTGLKDKEQYEVPKELFTGDIVKMHQFLFDGEEYEEEIIGVLKYNEELAAICLTNIKHHDIRKYMGYGNDKAEFEKEIIPICNFHGLHETSWTYLGNIYENPELINS